jgi:hypothetical protein
VAEGSELTIAFGPVGVAGLVLLAAGAVRRSLPLALLGGAALWADATRPELGGFAAARAAR